MAGTNRVTYLLLSSFARMQAVACVQQLQRIHLPRDLPSTTAAPLPPATDTTTARPLKVEMCSIHNRYLPTNFSQTLQQRHCLSTSLTCPHSCLGNTPHWTQETGRKLLQSAKASPTAVIVERQHSECQHLPWLLSAFFLRLGALKAQECYERALPAVLALMPPQDGQPVAMTQR